MTTKDEFTDEEWARLERSPMVAAMAISLADPGGPIEAVKESMAAIKTVQEAAQSATSPSLIREVATSLTTKMQARQNPMKDFKPKGALAGQEILDELRGRQRLVDAEGNARGGRRLPRVALASAKRAAEAAKEGGFMGFKAERVSEGEQDNARPAARSPRLARRTSAADIFALWRENRPLIRLRVPTRTRVHVTRAATCARR